MTDFTLRATTSLEYDDALALVRSLLADAGFDAVEVHLGKERTDELRRRAALLAVVVTVDPARAHELCELFKRQLALLITLQLLKYRVVVLHLVALHQRR